MPAHQKESFETWSNHQWSFAWFWYYPIKDQFQIHSKSGGTLVQALLLFLSCCRDKTELVETEVVQFVQLSFFNSLQWISF